MHEQTRSRDSNAVRMTTGHLDSSHLRGWFHAWKWETLTGRVLEDWEGENAITTQMAQLIANIMSRLGTNASGPAGGLWTAGPYIGLCTVTPTVASTLGSITEVSGGSYARLAPVWTYVGGPPAGYNNTAAASTWTAGTNITAGTVVTSLIITPASSGTGVAPNTTLQAFMALNGGNQTVASGNSLSVTYSWTVT